MLGRNAVIELVKDRLFPAWEGERAHLDRIDCWYRWHQESISLPRSATPELRELEKLSKVPWLGLVVTAAAQAMYVDGFRTALDTKDRDEDGAGEFADTPPWRTWLVNAMDRRQVAIHRAMLAYGISYATVLPGTDPLTGERQAVIRGVSPRKMHALYDDPAEDDWPTYALRVVGSKGDDHLVRLYDDEAVHTLRVAGPNSVDYVADEIAIHGAGVCPVVRYCNQLDLDGRTPGEVEPFIPLAAKINKTSYDRMLVQHFNSWKVRYVTGMAEPDDQETANRTKLKLRQDDILIAEDPDTKFGQLDETNMAGFIAAHKADIETLAAASQTPTHELTGQMANLSAEALAAARASLGQKITERQKSAGASHAQVLKLAAALDGHDDYARDHTARVTWQDMEIRSMSQAADALGKMVQMLGVPPTATWGRIPGVEKSDVQEWVALAERGDPITRMQERLAAQAAAVKQGASATGDTRVDEPDPTFDSGS